MGVWIEIAVFTKAYSVASVTPCVGVWIEMTEALNSVTVLASLPAWECGLKSTYGAATQSANGVTPCVGVWIEILCGIL